MGLLLGSAWLTGCTTPTFESSDRLGRSVGPSFGLAGRGRTIPENILVGRVVRANPTARFAIITFPVGVMAEPDQRLSVYRGQEKVGELKVSGPPRDESIAADIMEGDCQVGDEVRAQ